MSGEVVLGGCQPEPLGAYLKGLGAFRLAGEQVDAEIRACWRPAGLAITGIDREDLLTFLLERYRPTPLVAPWNGGSGFYPKDQKAGIEAIERSSVERLAGYRETLRIARDLAACAEEQGWPKRDKIEACRAELPDEAVAWIDAAVVLLDGDERYPPLLGTGGNLGRLELSNNFMQRLAQVLCLGEGRGAPTLERSRQWLEATLFGTVDAPRHRGPIGQFDPGGAGGANSSPFGDAESLVNPWEYVLLLEGTLLFASAAARRLAGDVPGKGAAGLPFMAQPTPFGYSTGTDGEPAKGELWAPLWERPATLREVAHLFGEGRADWRGHQARTGLDLARAAATVGVDRGVDEFVRHVFAERFGQAMLAVPVGRVRVRQRPEVPVLGDLDAWLDRLRRGTDQPATIASAVRRVERVMMAVALHVDDHARRLQEVLVAAAEAELAVGRAGRFRARAGIRPLGRLGAAAWLPHLDDGSAEFRLAVALASQLDPADPERKPPRPPASLRTLLRPIGVDMQGRLEWTVRPALVPGLGAADLPRVLAAALRRRNVEVRARRARERAEDAPELAPGQRLPDTGPNGVPTAYRKRLPAPVEDVVSVLSGGQLDEARLERLLMAMLLLDWSEARPLSPAQQEPRLVPPAYALLAPFFHGRPLRRPGADKNDKVLLEPAGSWPAQLAADQVEQVLKEAELRLRVARLDPAIRVSDPLAPRLEGSRLAAALLCPISTYAAETLLSQTAPPFPADEEANRAHPDEPAPAAV